MQPLIRTEISLDFPVFKLGALSARSGCSLVVKIRNVLRTLKENWVVGQEGYVY